MVATIASAARVAEHKVAAVAASESTGGKKTSDKCTIQWKWTRPGTGQAEQTAQVSFGVSSCRIQCKPTFTDNHYNILFARAFSVEDHGKYCACNAVDGGGHVIKFIGSCGDEEAAKKKCFNDYKILSTDELVEQFDKETLQVQHHPELHSEPAFDYNGIQCQTDGCAGNPDCFESVLPGIMSGRSPEEKKMIGHLMQKIMRGEIAENQLPGDVQALIGGLTAQDKEEILFTELLPEEYEAGDLTVGALKLAYTKKLEGTGISVDHLLNVAGLTDLDATLTYEMFNRFLKPDCNGVLWDRV